MRDSKEKSNDGFKGQTKKHNGDNFRVPVLIRNIFQLCNYLNLFRKYPITLRNPEIQVPWRVFGFSG